MGKFNGILICSDWDGTLCEGKSIPSKNIDAIRYFQKNGGTFTVCTGRYYPYIENFIDKVNPNTYLISLNGACIIDLKTKEKIYEGLVSSKVFDIIDNLIEQPTSYLQINLFEYNADESNSITVDEYRSRREEIVSKMYYKIVLVASTPEIAIQGRNYANSSGIPEIVAMRSWDTGLELISPENTKGNAVLRLKSKISAHTLIAVGDFENDISMLEVADVSYAVSNSIKDVKAMATRETCSVSDGALASIISEIEKEIG